MTVELCVIGGGRMGSALVGGALGAGLSPASVAIAELDPGRRAALADELPGVQIGPDPVAATNGIVAVKPPDAPAAAAALVAAGATRVLSIAAGVTLASLRAAVGPAVPLVRAMPNTPALVGSGAAAIAGDDAEALDWAEQLLSTVGSVVRVSESALDAVTGVSGSGPAYVFLFAEALIDAGVTEGLSREVASVLAIDTIRGAAELLRTGASPADLRAGVTSPGGTTAAGVGQLERHGVRAAVLDAVRAATERSRQLG